MIVVFDAEEFLTLYPQFQNVFSPSQLEQFFNVACLLCNNTENSPIADLNERKTLLYMLVCHIATLMQRGTAMPGLITSATEGKVSVGLQAYTNNPNWYNQTQCGSMYWLATAKYRVGMRYVPYCQC
jgi:hypothetical protein